MRKISNNTASILLISMYVIVILTGIMAAFVLTSVQGSLSAQRQRKNFLAEYTAQAGLARAIYDLRQDCLNDIYSPSFSDGTINTMSLTADTSNYYTVTAYNGNSINFGSYSVQFKNVEGKTDAIWIKSTGTIGDETESVTAYLKMYVISPWNTAVFGGSGNGTSVINNNANIRGTVFLLGTTLASDDDAMELGAGSYSVGNSYSGLSAGLLSRVPALSTTTVGAETVTTLNANLWVKTGMVSLLGSGTIGVANATGNSYKETLDGTFVTNGFGGSQGTANVYSDNGTAHTYPLGSTISFPSLSSAYDEYDSYQEYFEATALVLTNQLSNITPLSSFNYTDGTNTISLDGAGNMTVAGKILVNGNLLINKSGGNATVTYSGSAAILVTGTADVNVSLVTSGNESFPTNIIGIMTPGTLSFNEDDIEVMGLFFGESKIDVIKSMTVLGTLASNDLDFYSAEPSIYQVPAAFASVPTGMIAKDDATCFMNIVSWQKL